MSAPKEFEVLQNSCYWCGGNAKLKMMDSDKKIFWFCDEKCFKEVASIDPKEIQKTRLKLYTVMAELGLKKEKL